MTRPVFPRSWDALTKKANDILSAHSRRTGWVPSLPVPIETIVESDFDLRILWDDIEEPHGALILAMLEPEQRRIVVNERHAEGILAAVGPFNFTLAHELGHWLFDAVHPDQGQLFDVSGEPVFCRGAHALEESAKIREGNADRFAASVLLPRHLMPMEDLVAMNHDELRCRAIEYGVSAQALVIRVQQLLNAHAAQLPLS